MGDHSLFIPGSVDSHCHSAAMIEKKLPAGKLLEEARNAGLRAIIDVGISPDDLAERQDRLAGLDWISCTSGIHPSRATREDSKPMLAMLSSQIAERSIVAVGEIGLDYFWDSGSHEVAIDLFDQQVAMAVQADLPVIVHNREADADVLDVLRRHRPRGVMHCFSQTPEFCAQCLDLGVHISFAGNLTFKGSHAIRESALLVPHNRLLAETDSPYLSPLPVRGRPNHPGHLGFTIAALAMLRGEKPTETAGATAQNAAQLFGL